MPLREPLPSLGIWPQAGPKVSEVLVTPSDAVDIVVLGAIEVVVVVLEPADEVLPPHAASVMAPVATRAAAAIRW